MKLRDAARRFAALVTRSRRDESTQLAPPPQAPGVATSSLRKQLGIETPYGYGVTRLSFKQATAHLSDKMKAEVLVRALEKGIIGSDAAREVLGIEPSGDRAWDRFYREVTNGHPSHS